MSEKWKFLHDLYNKLDIPYFSDVYYPAEDSELFIKYFSSSEFIKDLENLIKRNQRTRSSLQTSQPLTELKVLDMGCGSGILGNFFLYSLLYAINQLKLSSRINQIYLDFVDINPSAIKSAQIFVQQNQNIIAQLKNQFSYIPDVYYGFYVSNMFEYIKSDNIRINNPGFDNLKDTKNKSLNKISSRSSQCYDFVIFNPPYLPSEPELINTSESENFLPIDHAWDGGSEDGLETIIQFIKEVPNYLNQNGIIYFAFSNLSNLPDLISKIKESGFSIKELAKVHFFFEDIILFKLIYQ